ncbi:hypothetical protein QNM99_16905 [Pseudomonas sp. PCH446]
MRSQAVMLKLQLQQVPTNLQAPFALQIENGQVHDAHARVGVKIAVPSYQHVAIGDEICVLWNGERPLPDASSPPTNWTSPCC